VLVSCLRDRSELGRRRLENECRRPIWGRFGSSFIAHMSRIILRGGVEVDNPLELALEFLAAYSSYEADDSLGPTSFDERDLRGANRGGARISAAEIAAILERRAEIERALRKVHPDASLADATSSIPWITLTRLFDAFADIRGIGFSKMTKALHPRMRCSGAPAPLGAARASRSQPGTGTVPRPGDRRCPRRRRQAGRCCGSSPART
jgi:hypothetical protein